MILYPKVSFTSERSSSKLKKSVYKRGYQYSTPSNDNMPYHETIINNYIGFKNNGVHIGQMQAV